MAHHVRLDKESLQSLFTELQKREYTIVGPRVNNTSVVYDTLRTTDDLPQGWSAEQETALHKLHKTGSPAYFGITHSMNAWLRYLYPSLVTLWKAHKDAKGFIVERPEEEVKRYALVGVRPCDLEALKKFDRILLHDAYHDERYKERRENAFIVTVNCTQPSGTCFCVSMKTGPKAASGFDIALTEVVDNGDHYFVAEAGSETGQNVINTIPGREADETETKQADTLVQNAAEHMGRTLDTENLKEILYRNYEHPHWDEVAERCFTCGNCTLVCPTCFCTTIEDYTDLTGDTAMRIRKWDSCYNNEFSYIHGGSVRTSSYARYRHWLMHKLATYQDQFETPGCVGCGRCITWCPAGIDITEEATAIRKHGKTL